MPIVIFALPKRRSTRLFVRESLILTARAAPGRSENEVPLRVTLRVVADRRAPARGTAATALARIRHELLAAAGQEALLRVRITKVPRRPGTTLARIAEIVPLMAVPGGTKPEPPVTGPGPAAVWTVSQPARMPLASTVAGSRLATSPAPAPQ